MAVTSPIKPFESQGERRRAQLVAIAAKLVIDAGPEAVTHATLAERAGVGRTAVYRYFPTRDDILFAVTSEWEELYSQQLTHDDVVAAVTALATAKPAKMPPSVRKLYDRLWAEENWTPARLELRLAAVLVLRDTSFLTRLRDEQPERLSTWNIELTTPLVELGLTDPEVAIVTDAMFAGQLHATAAALAGAIDRETAITLTYRSALAAVRAYLD